MSYEEEIKLHNKEIQQYDEKLYTIKLKLRKYEKDGTIEFRPSDQEFKMLHDAGYCTCDEDVGYTCTICGSIGLTFRQYLTEKSQYNYETLSWEDK